MAVTVKIQSQYLHSITDVVWSLALHISPSVYMLTRSVLINSELMSFNMVYFFFCNVFFPYLYPMLYIH